MITLTKYSNVVSICVNEVISLFTCISNQNPYFKLQNCGSVSSRFSLLGDVVI